MDFRAHLCRLRLATLSVLSCLFVPPSSPNDGVSFPNSALNGVQLRSSFPTKSSVASQLKSRQLPQLGSELNVLIKFASGGVHVNCLGRRRC